MYPFIAQRTYILPLTLSASLVFIFTFWWGSGDVIDVNTVVHAASNSVGVSGGVPSECFVVKISAVITIFKLVNHVHAKRGHNDAANSGCG